MTPQQMRYMADEMYRRAHNNECWDFLYSSGFKPVPPNVDDDWVVQWAAEYRAYRKAMNWSR